MKYFYLSLILIGLLLLPFKAEAFQANPDSLILWLQTNPEPDTQRVETLMALTTALYRGFPDSARLYAKEGLSTAQDINYVTGQATALRLIGYTHGVQGRSDSALYHFGLALELFKQLGDDRNIATINAAMATDYARNDDFERAIQGFLEASVYFNKLGNIQAEGVMYSNIGNVFLEQNLFTRARDYYDKAKITLLKSNTSNRNLSLVFTNLAMVSNALQSYEEAIDYANQAIEVGLNNEQYATLTSPFISKGRSLKTLGRIEEALMSFKEAEKYNQIRGSLKTKAEIQFDIASIHYQVDNYFEAKRYIDDVINVISLNDLTLNETLPNALLLSTKIEQNLGNNSLGIERALKAIDIIDSLHSQEMSLRISELETIYETEKKEAQIRFLEVENELANTQSMLTAIASAVILLLFISVSWLIYRKRAIEKEKRIESMKTELQKFGMVISEKNQFITSFRTELDDLRKHVKTLEGRKELVQMVDSIHQNVSLNGEEAELFSKIEQLNTGFYLELRKVNNELTQQDERLATLVQMDLSNKDISNILHIEPNSVKKAKYRLKRKLNLGTDIDLTNYLKSIAA